MAVESTATLNGRVAELESRVADQGNLISEREQEIVQLRQQAEASAKVEEALRQELAGAGKSTAVDKLRAENAALENQLQAARDERARLQRDLNVIHQQTESSWATERMENALLRERINDIAAEVAKLASAIEGPNSPIEAILAAEPMTETKAAPANGPAAHGGNVVSAGGTLADRIRALQSHASRARQTG